MFCKILHCKDCVYLCTSIYDLFHMYVCMYVYVCVRYFICIIHAELIYEFAINNFVI
jgi:hypothetical protein